jgi:DNA end-binding protein Ku
MARKKSRAHKSEAPETNDRPGPRSFWSGTLSFGLVSIPVELYRGTRSAGISLRMLAEDGTPLSRRYVSAADGAELSDEDLVRGYEISPGEHVPITDEEIESLEPAKSRDIDLRRFVPLGSIDPIYFDRPFFLAPAGDSTKAYRLLADTMQRTKRVGVATFVMNAKEHLVAIVAQGGLLRAHLLRFKDEVRGLDDVGLPKRGKPEASLVAQYRKLIEKRAADELDTELLRDEGTAKVRALIEKKEKQHRDVVEHEGAGATGEAPEARIIDLMEVLKQSLSKGAQKDAAKETKRAQRK